MKKHVDLENIDLENSVGFIVDTTMTIACLMGVLHMAYTAISSGTRAEKMQENRANYSSYSTE